MNRGKAEERRTRGIGEVYRGNHMIFFFIYFLVFPLPLVISASILSLFLYSLPLFIYSASLYYSPSLPLIALYN